MPGVGLESLEPSLTTTLPRTVIFRKNSQNRQFSVQFARLGKVKITSRASTTLQFNTVYYCSQIVGKLPPIAPILITRDLGLLNNVVTKIDYVVKLHKSVKRAF